ncbi:MAG: hypothetical protein NWT00_05925, partial [Beijerinckiaceae bacterium]|nr:hypothetical protein [Beijerinckiaceae bacterium]
PIQLQEPIQQSAGSRLAGRPRWHLAIPAHALLIMLVAIFMVPGIAARDVALAQYEDANPAVYWRLERQRQNAFKRNRVRDQRKVIIQRPTRLIRRARPSPARTIQ